MTQPPMPPKRPRMTDAEKELSKHVRNWMQSPLNAIYLERMMDAIVTFELHARIAKLTMPGDAP